MCLAQTKEAINIFSDKIEDLGNQINDMRSEKEINALRSKEPVIKEKPPSVSSVFKLLRGGKK